MQRVQFNIPESEQEKASRQALIDSLKNSSIIQNWCKENNQDFNIVETNAYKFKQYVKRKQLCENCSGLHMCTQKQSGNILELEMDEDILISNSRSCKYLKEENKVYAHKNHYSICDMSDEQLKLSFSTLDLTKEPDSYIKVALSLRKATKEMNKGFYICGNPGVGKTYLACCFINEMAKQDKKCAFVNVPSFFASLKNKMGDKDAFEKQILDATNADVLVLDDIGGESVSNWSRDEILLPMLNERMEKNKCTIFTSNYEMNNLEKYYAVHSKFIHDEVGAKRIMDRIRTLSKEYKLICKNRRNY